jgi:hypothetical protein
MILMTNVTVLHFIGKKTALQSLCMGNEDVYFYLYGF